MEALREIKFSVRMTTSYLFDFLYWHSYHGMTGVINYALSLAGVVALMAGFGKGNTAVTIMLIVLALLFTVINPLSLLYKAARQKKKTAMFQKPLYYCFNSKGFTISQESSSDSAKWENIVFIRETGKSIILYMGASNAIVLPKKECGNQLSDLKKLLHANLPELAKKLKK